ncbi:MAG: hypothetical protein OXR68_05630 [Alphaproteobacteria bacterium]|nr:hypothetical protein [Alphaproteobacteria bacterium]
MTEQMIAMMSVVRGKMTCAVQHTNHKTFVPSVNDTKLTNLQLPKEEK